MKTKGLDVIHSEPSHAAWHLLRLSLLQLRVSNATAHLQIVSSEMLPRIQNKTNSCCNALGCLPLNKWHLHTCKVYFHIQLTACYQNPKPLPFVLVLLLQEGVKGISDYIPTSVCKWKGDIVCRICILVQTKMSTGCLSF